MSFAVLIVAIAMGTITFVTLASIWLGTSYSLKKLGYDPNQMKETYNLLRSDLQRISADLEKIREHIADLIILNHDRRSKRS
ncbi:hypothetical protein HYR99_02860 [Candidatus Poribacteria bacterium]|nr:hypothetical protein [Candidatus Poribacteria bacterium]